IGAVLGVAGFREWETLWVMHIQRGDFAAEQPGFDVVDRGDSRVRESSKADLGEVGFGEGVIDGHHPVELQQTDLVELQKPDFVHNAASNGGLVFGGIEGIG
ncbi:hypothetical protein Dimus_021288, partial [Dionaea muscipula]